MLLTAWDCALWPLLLLAALITSIKKLPSPLNTTIRNQGGGAWNHAVYFKVSSSSASGATASDWCYCTSSISTVGRGQQLKSPCSGLNAAGDRGEVQWHRPAPKHGDLGSQLWHRSWQQRHRGAPWAGRSTFVKAMAADATLQNCQCTHETNGDNVQEQQLIVSQHTAELFYVLHALPPSPLPPSLPRSLSCNG